jgi:hypothetical protein
MRRKTSRPTTTTTPPIDRLAGRCLHLSQQRLLGVVSEPLGVGVGGELVNGTGLDLVLNLLGGAATAASFKVRLVRA